MAKQRILQNNLLVWLDSNIDENEADTQFSLQHLQAIVHHVTLFKQVNDCVQYLQTVYKEKVLLITSVKLARDLIPQVHEMSQIDEIFILDAESTLPKSYVDKWTKIQGSFVSIQSMCDLLKQAIKQSNEDLTPISFVVESNAESSTTDRNRLEPSFMYTTLFKRILLEMKHEPNERQTIVNFCRINYAENRTELAIVEEFNRNYCSNEAIWWYTRECFTYQMLNRALRLLESDIIIDMGFFIHDLHRHLEQLHRDQFANYTGESLILYRGQALSMQDFGKLQRSQNGLIAFNNFLSTSTMKRISLEFAKQHSIRENTVGILFVMTVDPTLSSTPFASIKEHSFFHTENEILFSMHTIFRIGGVNQLDKAARLFEVQLTLTNDDDPELRRLTDRIEKDIADGTGWERLGRLLMDIEQLDKAEELYLALMKQKADLQDQGLYQYQLGLIKHRQGNYDKALQYYQEAVSIHEKILPSTHPTLAIFYGRIGALYDDMGESSEALSYYNKAVHIQEKNLSENHPHLATSYSEIGLIYDNVGDYSKALSYYTKALDIREKTLPTNHPDLATAYNNIGGVYSNMTDHSKALSYYKKALNIDEKVLPDNHPSLATSYVNIAGVYDDLGEYFQALHFYNKALAIFEVTLPKNHPKLATSYSNIALVYNHMEDYSQALSFYKKAIIIRERSVPINYSDLALSYYSIGLVYPKIGDHSQALINLNKALDIRMKTLPENDPELAMLYTHLGNVHNQMRTHKEALIHYQKALDIEKRTLPDHHLSMATSYNNIGATYFEIKDYSQALSYFQKALTIMERFMPAEHPNIQTLQQSIDATKEKLK